MISRLIQLASAVLDLDDQHQPTLTSTFNWCSHGQCSPIRPLRMILTSIQQILLFMTSTINSGLHGHSCVIDDQFSFDRIIELSDGSSFWYSQIWLLHTITNNIVLTRHTLLLSKCVDMHFQFNTAGFRCLGTKWPNSAHEGILMWLVHTRAVTSHEGIQIRLWFTTFGFGCCRIQGTCTFTCD